jgi:hypothetical protein
MDLPEQKCARLLGFALRREDNTEGEKRLLPRYKIVMSVGAVSTAQRFFVRPENRNRECRNFCQFFQKHNASGENQKPKRKINSNSETL